MSGCCRRHLLWIPHESAPRSSYLCPFPPPALPPTPPPRELASTARAGDEKVGVPAGTRERAGKSPWRLIPWPATA